ncbi:MAG: AAA family ATPase [Phormidium sp.]
MRVINDWLGLAKKGIKIVGLEYYTTDRTKVLTQFYQWGQKLQLPVLFWNSGYSCFQEVISRDGQCILRNTGFSPNSDVPQFLLEKGREGIYLLEGLLDFDEHSYTRTFQLTNAYYHLSWSNARQYWVMLENYIQLPMNLQPLIPVLTTPMPDRNTVQRIVASFCTQNLMRDNSALVRACQGLPEGEIELVLGRSLAFASKVEKLADLVLDHKVNKLRGRGLEFIAQPDVPNAGGLDLLDESLSRVASLLSPEAQKYGLKFPKGMILWGPPGTGKSLSAKLAAKKMGVPLLAADWGSIVGASRPDFALRELLELTQALSPTILYWDDFDKGFAGWDSNADGGVSRRLSGKLLTWMQEHEYPIYIVATVNRLGMLPPELIRRFDDIFNLHLQKYFPEFRHASISPWTDDEWRILLRDYTLCTPAEIGNAVRKCAEEIYYRHQVQGQQPDELKVTLDDLRRQRYQFTPSMLRDEEQILAIRNQATYAKSASGEDRSRFSLPLQELFG